MEVKYVPSCNGSGSPDKMVPIDKPKKCSFIGGGKLSLLLSILTLGVSVSVFCLLFAWLHGVPQSVQNQAQVVAELSALVARQQAEIRDLQVELDSSSNGQQQQQMQGSPCTLERDSGNCMAAMPRWFFDSEKGRCDQFIYGGCRGNGNNFITLADCRKECEVSSTVLIDDDEGNDCLLAPDAGPCLDQLPRFYYDAGDLGCKKFLYSGCAGNRNNFVTESQCTSQCSATNKE